MSNTIESVSPATASPVTPTGTPRTLRWTVPALAFACGASVANLYYAQPLLGPIGRSLGVGTGTATLIVTMTQIGYALGLMFLTPLGDLMENRRLVTRTLIVTAVVLVLAATAPDIGVFLAASVLVGLTSVVAQILVPLSSHLAPPEIRGKVVGQVTGGLLLGIMLARSASSILATAWGWRSVYVVSSVIMLAVALLLRLRLAERTPEHTASYPSLLASTFRLARHEPLLRRRSFSQAAMFAAFTAFWTAVPYELTERHHMSQSGIALFALVGAAGAASAPVAGRLGDRGHSKVARGAALGLALVAIGLAALGASHVALLALAAVLLDFAVQGHHVLSVRDVYGLSTHARARMNSLYMTGVFVGGAAASAVTGTILSAHGWSGVMGLAACLVAAGMTVWLWETSKRPSRETHRQ
ncbi:putative MFS family arabinose efflux permease [Catenulispora sp. GP43]|uniref:MFS transporter n=1 Tax=Catenulispora sp. GP43 TaxID=3156263 RepID=UPI003516A9C3